MTQDYVLAAGAFVASESLGNVALTEENLFAGNLEPDCAIMRV